VAASIVAARDVEAQAVESHVHTANDQRTTDVAELRHRRGIGKEHAGRHALVRRDDVLQVEEQLELVTGQG